MGKYFKWQVGAIGSLSIFTLIVILVNLAGMDSSHSGDIVCTDCFSEIQVNSTYWQICAEHAGEDENALFAKRARSHTRWINLDKITEIVSTDPKIHVDLMVPATKKSADIVSEEYGYLRNVKDGDCIIKRRTKSNDRPSKFYLHAEKGVLDTVKWSFDMEDLFIENINIDPKWLPGCNKAVCKREVCDTKTTEETIDIYGLVPKLSLVAINYTYYVNNTICSDEPFNLTCSTSVFVETRQRGEHVYKDNYEYIGNYVHYKNKSVNCRLLGIVTPLFKVDCPDEHRCSMEKGAFCACDLPDCADIENWYDSSHRIDNSWSYACTKISDMFIGKEISTSSFKNTRFKVEKI